MEAATVPTSEATKPDAAEASAEQPTERLFQYSGWVHVGPGAEECGERFTGKCADEDHFHAWCRLPNPYQQRDLAEKGRAAKARKMRAMKDPESDSYEILEAALDELRELGDRELLVGEALDREWAKDFEAAMKRVEDEDEFENYQQDRQEWLRQRELPEDERDGEEFAQLDATVERFGARVEEALREIQQPRREGLMEADIEDLISQARRERIESAGNEAYLHTYNTWMFYACTLKPRGVTSEGKPLRPREMVFGSINELKSAPEEVILTIKDTFEALEQKQAKGRAAKNS